MLRFSSARLANHVSRANPVVRLPSFVAYAPGVYCLGRRRIRHTLRFCPMQAMVCCPLEKAAGDEQGIHCGTSWGRQKPPMLEGSLFRYWQTSNDSVMSHCILFSSAGTSLNWKRVGHSPQQFHFSPRSYRRRDSAELALCRTVVADCVYGRDLKHNARRSQTWDDGLT